MNILLDYHRTIFEHLYKYYCHDLQAEQLQITNLQHGEGRAADSEEICTAVLSKLKQHMKVLYKAKKVSCVVTHHDYTLYIQTDSSVPILLFFVFANRQFQMVLISTLHLNDE